jgi:hypothetical protein
MSTLEKMSISIPEQLIENSQRLSDVQKILGEVAEFGEKMKEMSLGIKRIERKIEGTCCPKGGQIYKSLTIAIAEGELENLVQWISPIEPPKRHRDIVLKRLDGTGGWFTQMQSFKDWRGSGDSKEHSHVFGCYGKPGAGKSVIW